jgi:hypothetical protein
LGFQVCSSRVLVMDMVVLNETSWELTIQSQEVRDRLTGHLYLWRHCIEAWNNLF